MTDPFLERRAQLRAARKERWKSLKLWCVFLVLVGLHVAFYAYFTEIVEFIELLRDGPTASLEEVSNID